MTSKYQSVMYCHQSKRKIDNTLWYNNCHIHPKTTLLYDKSKPIHKLMVKPVGKLDDSPYWAWWDYEEDRYVFLYPTKGILSMVFPYPITAYEKKGEGKAFNVMMEELDVLNPSDL